MSILSLIKSSGTKVAMLAAAVFSVFIFLSSFEAIFLYDLKYVYAIETLHSTQLQEALTFYTIEDVDIRATGVVGTPYILKIPSQRISLRMARGIAVKGSWLTQASRAHYLMVHPNDDIGAEHLITYATSNWRTIPQAGQLEVGNNIFIDTTEGWRYMHRITQIDVVNMSDSYVPPASDSSLLLLFIEDNQAGLLYIVRADFINVQNNR